MDGCTAGGAEVAAAWAGLPRNSPQVVTATQNPRSYRQLRVITFLALPAPHFRWALRSKVANVAYTAWRIQRQSYFLPCRWSQRSIEQKSRSTTLDTVTPGNRQSHMRNQLYKRLQDTKQRNLPVRSRGWVPVRRCAGANACICILLPVPRNAHSFSRRYKLIATQVELLWFA